MKRSYAMTLFIVLLALIIPYSAHAVTVDQPHAGVTTSFTCSTCHSGHLTLGSDATGFNNVCQTCHRVGDSAAGAKPITSADAANPYNNHTSYGIKKIYQTSHRWDGPGVEPRAGAKAPIQPGMTSVTSRTFGQLACSRCHNQHNNKNGKFLRISNDGDTMCMDCHRSRAVQSHTLGSHPVNVPIPVVNFNNPIQNNNPANPTSDLSAKLSGGNLVCSTCHGIHYTDSRSSTYDGYSSAAGRGKNFVNLSTGDGYLLRTDMRGKSTVRTQPDSLNICTNCHAGKKNHNYKNQDIQCSDCHSAHVDYDPNDPDNIKGTNVYLIKRNVKKDGQPSQILFRYTGVSRREYKNPEGTGVCQGCHDVPQPGAGLPYPQQHALSTGTGTECNACHAHNTNKSLSSFSGACAGCHGNPPADTSIGVISGVATGLASPATGMSSPGAHVLHATTRGMECSVCHNGYASNAMPNSTIDIGFAIDSAKYPGFKTSDLKGMYGNTNILGIATNGQPYSFTGSVDRTGTIAANQTCVNVYCHGATLKNDAGVNTGTNTTPNWTITNNTQAQCDSCHAVFGEGPGTAGHLRHASSLNMGCSKCHGTLPSVTSSGGWNGPNHINGVVDWNVAQLSAQSGSPLPGYKATNGVYLTVGSTTTLPPSTAYGSCTNIYCHSSVQGAGGLGAPTSFASPVWGGAALDCGGCHVNMASDPAATGSHIKHAQTYGIACATCHSGYTASTTNAATHVINQKVDVTFPGAGISAGSKYASSLTASSSRSPGAGYASCTTNYCHSNSAPNGSARVYPASAPVWGATPLNCGSCHADMSTLASTAPNGGHFKHASNQNATGPDYDCAVCHTGYTATSVTTATHVNQSVELNTVVTGYSKPSPMTASGAWGTCSTNVCHGQATSLSWNNGAIWQSGGDHCTTCHSSAASVTSSGLFYSTVYNGIAPVKQTSNANSKVGAHVSHLNSTDSLTAPLSCSDCHTVPGTVTAATHMTGTTNMAWSALASAHGANPSYVGGVCSNVYCHGAKMPDGDDSGSSRTATWNIAFLPASLTLPASCNTCHGFPPQTTGTHTSIHPVVSADLGTCAGCHPNINGSALTYANVFKDKTLHINGIVDVSGAGGCNGCHGYPPANKRFVGTHNNWSSARAENYSSAGGSHTIAAHVPPTADPSQGFNNCTNCHNQLDHNMGAGFASVANIKVTILSRLRFSNTPSFAKYSSNKQDGTAHVSGRCSNVSCHFQKTPKW